MFRLRSALLPLLGFIAFAGASAAPVKFADVAPGSAWVGHVDFDRVAAGKIGPALAGGFRGKDGSVDAKLKALAAKTGLDPARDIRGITVYGDGTKDDATMLVYLSASVATLRATIARENKTETTVVDGVTVLKLDKESGDAVYLAIHDNGPVVVAKNPRAVATAVKAQGGSGFVPGPEWAGAIAGRAPLFVLTALLERLPAGRAKSAQIKDAKSATLVIDESRDTLAVSLLATMTDDASARKAADMAKGLAAFAAKNGTDARKVALLNAVKIDASADRVSVELSVSTDEILDAVKAMDGGPGLPGRKKNSATE